jgi:hypothetical protein
MPQSLTNRTFTGARKAGDPKHPSRNYAGLKRIGIGLSQRARMHYYSATHCRKTDTMAGKRLGILINGTEAFVFMITFMI